MSLLNWGCVMLRWTIVKYYNYYNLLCIILAKIAFVWLKGKWANKIKHLKITFHNTWIMSIPFEVYSAIKWRKNKMGRGKGSLNRITRMTQPHFSIQAKFCIIVKIQIVSCLLNAYFNKTQRVQNAKLLFSRCSTPSGNFIYV
jgi:hypothetical protein